MDHIDLKYAMMLSGRLSGFKIVSHKPYKINFRCPYCGDSNKSATKARGWLQESNKTGGFRFFCFNCGHPASFYDFLKVQDPLSFRDYVAERYVNTARGNTEPILPDGYGDAPRFTGNPLKKIKKISQLKADHPAKVYIDSRNIPSNKHYLIYYAPKFKTWINEIIPDKFDMKDKWGKPRKDEPRLTLPFFDEKGQVFGVSARSFDPDGLRYISIMFDESQTKIFGLQGLRWDKDYFIVEGAIDSMFLNNAIAMAGADGNLSTLKNTENAIVVFDCEFRNKEIYKRMEKAINQGLRVCIWPNHMADKGKDINQFVLSGIPAAKIETIIRENTYKGLMAKAILTERMRV